MDRDERMLTTPSTAWMIVSRTSATRGVTTVFRTHTPTAIDEVADWNVVGAAQSLISSTARLAARSDQCEC